MSLTLRWIFATACLGLMVASTTIAGATECDVDTSGTGLAFPIAGPNSLEPTSTKVQLLELDVSLSDKGTSAIYHLANPGPATALVLAIPIFAAQDEERECESVTVTPRELSVSVDGQRASGTITPVVDDTVLAADSPRFDAIFVAQIPFTKRQRRVVEVGFATAWTRSDSPSSYGQYNTVLRWPMAHLDKWPKETIAKMTWKATVGAANHCLASAQWGGLRFDGKSKRVLAGARKVAANQALARLGLYLEWETQVPWDSVYLARGDFAEELAPLVEALEARRGVVAVTKSMTLDVLEAAYAGFFEAYVSRNAPDTPDRDLRCQEVDVASFLKSVEGNLPDGGSSGLTVEWLKRRPPRPLTLSGFSKIGRRVMRALKAELHRRHVKSRPLPPR